MDTRSSLDNKGYEPIRNSRDEPPPDHVAVPASPSRLAPAVPAEEPFRGLKPFRTQIKRRHNPLPRERLVEKEDPLRSKNETQRILVSIGNFAWLLLFGWWIFLAYVFASLLLVLTCNMRFARWTWKMKNYYLWPFGKYLFRRPFDEDAVVDSFGTSSRSEHSMLVGDAGPTPSGTWRFQAVAALLLVPVHAAAFMSCWMPVVLVPMAKVNWTALKLCFRRPLQVDVGTGYPNSAYDVLVCTYHAANTGYIKYTVGGINIVLFNLLPFVGFSLALGYLFPLFGVHPHPVLMFICCISSFAPLSYYIGLAISSLAAQTSLTVGALLNASFGSFVELVLFGSALRRGDLDELVQASIVGMLLTMMLLLPGVCMVAGAIKYPDEQRFNAVSSGIGSILLFTAIIGAFTPTIFYRELGANQLMCRLCNMTLGQVPLSPAAAGGAVVRLFDGQPLNGSVSGPFDCSGCFWGITADSVDHDPVWTDKARPLMFTCAAILPLAYFIGLFFTLKTHAHKMKFDAADSGSEHEAPEWSKLKCVVIVVITGVTLVAVAEALVEVMKETLDTIGLTQRFAGMTIIALIPDIAEFLNAVQFAMSNNIALSMEIAIAASVQISLIQVPALVFLSAIATGGTYSHAFTMIFPTLDVFTVILGVIIFSLMSLSGRANYFLGSSLIIIYLLMLSAYYWIGG